MTERSGMFNMRACEYDREGYYYPRWDLATPVSVVAETKQEAINTAARLLGPARRGRYWRFKVDSIAPPPAAARHADPDRGEGQA